MADDDENDSVAAERARTLQSEPSRDPSRGQFLTALPLSPSLRLCRHCATHFGKITSVGYSIVMYRSDAGMCHCLS